MKSLTKLSLIFLAVTSTGLLPITCNATPNEITFAGEINANTCVIDVNGDAVSPIVLLPTISESDLVAVGSEAGVTEFTISISGCDGSSVTAGIIFSAGLTDGAGNLMSTGTANNVAIALSKGGGANFDFTPGLAVDLTAFAITSPATSASEVYQVKYRSELGGATAGSVVATVNYAMTYF